MSYGPMDNNKLVAWIGIGALVLAILMVAWFMH